MSAGEQIDAIRAQIDAVDDAILDLVARRLSLAGSLAAAKAAERVGSGLALRPAREVQLVRRMIAQAPAGMDPDLVVELWRALMSAGLRKQQSLEIVVAGGPEGPRLFDCARRHFGASARITRADDARTALTRAVSDPGCVAALAWPTLPGQGAWWPILNERRFHPLSVIAALPLRADPAAPEPEAAVVAAGAALEPAGADQTLAVAFDPHHRVSRALNEAGLSGREVSRARETVLIRLDGFIAPADPRVPALMHAGLDGLRVVGSFARI